MKKILFVVYILAGLLLASNYNINVSDLKYNEHQINNLSFTKDEVIKVDLTLNGRTLSIKHEGDLSITGVVIEYVFIDNNENVSKLLTLDVNSNGNTMIPSESIAVKVQQVLMKKNQVVYRYTAGGKNSVPSNFNWDSVVRKDFIVIETTEVRKVESKVPLEKYGYDDFRFHQYYEFYFNFNEKHDELISIDTDYILLEEHIIGSDKEIKMKDHNLSSKEKWNLKYDKIGIPPSGYPLSESIDILSKNLSSDFKGNYVARIAPTAQNYDNEEGSKRLPNDYKIKNFAIIRVEYTINGEYKLEDVLNEPVTPDYDDDMSWFKDFIRTIKNMWKSFSGFFNSNLTAILVIIVIIILLILLPIIVGGLSAIITIIKIIISTLIFIIKLPIIIIVGFFNLIKMLFVPKDEKNEKERLRR